MMDCVLHFIVSAIVIGANNMKVRANGFGVEQEDISMHFFESLLHNLWFRILWQYAIACRRAIKGGGYARWECTHSSKPSLCI